METIGERIRRIRKDREYRQEDLAPLVGMTQSSLSYVESKNKVFTAEQLMALCRVLQVSPEYIVFGGEEEDMGTIEIMQLFKQLPPKERDMLLRTARALLPTGENSAAA